MKRNLLLTLYILYCLSASSQNLSFYCARDTVLGCGTNCLNIVARFPDMRELGNDYTITDLSNISLCNPYTNPAGTGPSTNLVIDDRYSSVIPLPFTFPFYGVPYNALVASTNGFVSFDISLTGGFSHYNNNGDLPNFSYDPALIMGPYHDLDPSETTSPTQQIKYETFGSTPNRKWILSFFKVPMYSGGCANLINNTHQIILHESTGIIEVKIIDKEICIGWNGGKAMVGLQDFTKTKGITAPGRRMSDPPWGSIGMNENWRFIPSGGLPLFRSVELLNAAGTTIARGDTTRIDANTFEWIFTNICPASNATTLYVIKTTYAKLTDLATTIYSLDTIRVLRNAMPVSSSFVNTTCGASIGSMTVIATGGTPPLSYVLNPGSITNTTGIFTGLGVGNYTVTVTDASGTCTNSTTQIITAVSSLTANVINTNASCPGVNNGSITVTPTSGTGPYSYSANGGSSQPSGVFSNLSQGNYTIIFTDALGCNGFVTALIGPGTIINASNSSTATSCAGAADGTITVTPTSGTGPYLYSLDGGAFVAGNIFTAVSAGIHNIIVEDAGGCRGTIVVDVTAGNSLSGNIFQTALSCPGANDGTITLVPTNGIAPYLFILDAGTPQASGTFSGVTAGPHTVFFTDANSCSGDRSINVNPGTSASTGSATTSPSCNGASDGIINITPVAGAVYTLNPGNISNTTGVFTGLAAGSYTATYLIPPGFCVGSVTPANIIIAPGPILTSSFTRVNPVCANINNGSISITPQAAGIAPFIITLTGPGAPFTLSGNSPIVFSNLAAGTYNYIFSSANGCDGTGGPVLLTTNSPLMMPATLTLPSCNGNINGVVSFIPSGGVGPYQYSNNAGVSYQQGNTFNALAAGTYNYRIRDNVGCTKDTTIIITQPAVLNSAARSGVTAGCGNNDGGITATGSGGTTPYTFTIAGPSVNTSGAVSGIFTGLATGNHTITVRDYNGCTSAANATVVLIDNMFLTLGPDVTICAENSVTFNPQTNAQTNVFAWSSSATIGAGTIDNPALKNAAATPADTTEYILTAQWGTCQRVDSIIVNILHKPVADAGKDTSICNISYATLSGTASNLSGSVNYLWSPATGVQFPNEPRTTVFPAGNNTTYIYTLTVTDNYGCKFSVTDQINVRVQPPVPAYAGNDTTAVQGVPHQLIGSGGKNYLWSPSFALNNALIKNPLATLQNDTKFIVEVTDVAGCIGYDTIFIKVYNGPAYYIPNAFSPNGDGQNDIFRAIPVGIVKTEWFRIFNRYGEVVFETNEWLKGWDGNYKGKKQAIGAYIWIIKGTDRNGKSIEMKGTVMLLQ